MKYLNSDMSPLFKPGSPADIIGKQMDFLFNEGKKLAKKLDIDYQDFEADIQIQKSLEEDMFDEEYTCEEMEAADAKAELAYDAHKEECPKIDHEECF